MAKPMDDADKLKRAARRRLVGAIVLTIIIVTLIPLLLDNEPSLPQSNIELRIPNKDQVAAFNPNPPTAAPPAVDVADLDNRPISPPLPTTSAPSVAAPAANTPTINAVTDNVPATSVPEKNSAVVQKLATPPKSSPPKAAPPTNNKAAPKSGFIVQAGAFSNIDSAQDLQKKLSAIGIKTYTEKVGGMTRVRAGAYPTRAAADKIARKLEAQGLKPVVISASTTH